MFEDKKAEMNFELISIKNKWEPRERCEFSKVLKWINEEFILNNMFIESFSI